MIDGKRQPRTTRFAAALAAAGLAALAALAVASPAPPLAPGAPPAAPGTELIVRGVNGTDRPLPLWVRVDGPTSASFGTRANLFRAVAPGAFALRINRADLADAAGAPLDLGADPAVRVFAHEGAPGLAGVEATWSPPPARPPGVFALDFGPAGGAVFPGFDPADETAAGVAGRRVAPVSRPGDDALARDGLVGVEAIRLAPPPGRYLVKLWIEDLGAWEYLPHQLRHRVRVNGRPAVDRTETPEGWVAGRWLGGAAARFRKGDTAWRAFGARRAGLAPLPVEIGADGLRIEFAGDAAGATFVAALAVVPEAEAGWIERVTAMQTERFDAAWPIDVGAVDQDSAFHAGSARLTLARGQTGWLRLDAGTEGAVALAPPGRAGAVLPASLRLGLRRLDRPSPLSPFLAPLARAFHAAPETPEADPLGRPALVEVTAPPDALPGLYRGTLRAAGVEQPFAVEVAAVALPAPPGPVGVYLADPPHHRWFRSDPRPDRTCRLRTLAAAGLSGVSPPLAVPTPDLLDVFAADARLATEAFGDGRHLAYQEAQRLFEALPPQRAVAALAAADRAAPGLVWSLADEPSNPSPHGRSLAGHAAEIRAAAPGIRLAAHLNAPADREVAPLFDVALVNPGYGIDSADIAGLSARGVEAWIYNTGPERLAAGFYGWRVGAAGFFQWHALMPTADPFDPTDGREGDALLLPPDGDPCAAAPPLDERLVRIAEGAADRRWLAWLDARSETSAEAAALRARLRAAIPATWDEARRALGAAELDRFRAEIAALAPAGEG